MAVRVDVPHAASRTAGRIYRHAAVVQQDAHAYPETFWLFNRPIVSNPKGWSLEKLGSWVNAADATSVTTSTLAGPTTCGVHLHAVGDAMGDALLRNRGACMVTSLDSALLSVGEPIAVPTPLSVPNATGGALCSSEQHLEHKLPVLVPFHRPCG